MYAIKWSGKFQDAERGIITKSWLSTDENGNILMYATKKEALAEAEAQDKNSGYDGIYTHNILSHDQLSGDAPKVVTDAAYWSARPIEEIELEIKRRQDEDKGNN